MLKFSKILSLTSTLIAGMIILCRRGKRLGYPQKYMGYICMLQALYFHANIIHYSLDLCKEESFYQDMF
jgi:hypothetical protein